MKEQKLIEGIFTVFSVSHSQSSSTSEKIEERAPFIVLAATVKNDDPNEALIPTR